MSGRYFAAAAMLPGGWAEDVVIETSPAGDIAAVHPNGPPQGAARLGGPVIAGMPNVHSHAFQRAMAGRAERCERDRDDTFWTWRETMYGLVARVTPEDAGAIATWLYTEMLKAGYTAVGEFHYLYHAPDGAPYAVRTEMCDRIVAAAQQSGIGLTLLPALYTYGGFGERAPSQRQRRFTMAADAFCGVWDALAASMGENPQHALGVAPHSLRAVSPRELKDVLAHVAARRPDAPIHMHVAEQQAEVEACLAWSGARPVAWLLEHVALSPSWCLVHATHVDESERRAAAPTGAVAGLCPTTEGNLGDGIFPAGRWMEDGGRVAVGSDSHVTLDPAEELRWLEYGQRLVSKRRAVLCNAESPSVGGTLYRAALAGGAQSLGRRIGRIAPGFRADLVVLDGAEPAFEGATGDDVLDRYIFGGVPNAVRDVMVGGRWVVTNRHAEGEEAAQAAFRASLQRLFGRTSMAGGVPSA